MCLKFSNRSSSSIGFYPSRGNDNGGWGNGQGDHVFCWNFVMLEASCIEKISPQCPPPPFPMRGRGSPWWGLNSQSCLFMHGASNASFILPPAVVSGAWKHDHQAGNKAAAHHPPANPVTSNSTNRNTSGVQKNGCILYIWIICFFSLSYSIIFDLFHIFSVKGSHYSVITLRLP